ncbi:O-antigen translocase [Vibrio cyclitrophicus]
MKILKLILMGGSLTALRMVMGFIVTKFIAVYAGPTGVALAGQLQSFVMAINGVIATEMSKAVVRFTSQHQASGIEAMSKWWSAVTSLIVIVLSIFIPLACLFSSNISQWLFGSELYQWVVIIALIALPLNAMNSILLSTLNGLGENKKNISSSMISIIISTVVVLFLLQTIGIEGALIALSLNNAIAGLVVLFRVYNSEWLKIRYWFGKIDSDKLKPLYGYMVMGVVGATTGPTSIMLIRNLIVENYSIVDAGIWQSVWRISSAYISVITFGVSMYYFPIVAKINSRSELLIETRSVLMIVIPASLISGLCIYYLREQIIYLLFSDEFVNASDLFFPQVVGDIIRTIAFVPACVIMARGYIKVNIVAEVVINLIFVGLVYFMLPSFGLIGVNYSYAILYFIYLIFAFTFLYFHLNTLD